MPVKICNPSILKLLFNEQNVSNEGIRSNVEARNFRQVSSNQEEVSEK